MTIKNLEGLTIDQINREIAHGGKFVIYQFTISIIIMTFRRSSDVYFLRASENGLIKGLPFTLLTFVLGWWGIPWGPIYSVGSLYHNLRGGKDITDEVIASVSSQVPATSPA